MKSSDHFLFFAISINSEHALLAETEVHHAVKVLRIKDGDPVTITDGLGTIALCTFSAQGVCPVVQSKKTPMPTPAIAVYVGLPDLAAFESIIVNCSALGAVRIIPVVCNYCQEKWWAKRWDAILDRLNKKMVVAIKQAHNPFLPVLDEPVTFKQALDECRGGVVVAESSGQPVFLFEQTSRSLETISAFVGPPGGFSPDELQLFQEKNATFVSIAPYRLRTELAATILTGILRAGTSS